MRNNTRKSTAGRPYLQKQKEYLIGTAIMVRHGSPNAEKAPYEIYKGQRLNRLCFIPFMFKSNPNKGREYNSDEYWFALINHNHDVAKVMDKKFKKFETYALPKYQKTSVIVKKYA